MPRQPPSNDGRCSGSSWQQCWSFLKLLASLVTQPPPSAKPDNQPDDLRITTSEPQAARAACPQFPKVDRPGRVVRPPTICMPSVEQPGATSLACGVGSVGFRAQGGAVLAEL